MRRKYAPISGLRSIPTTNVDHGVKLIRRSTLVNDKSIKGDKAVRKNYTLFLPIHRKIERVTQSPISQYHTFRSLRQPQLAEQQDIQSLHLISVQIINLMQQHIKHIENRLKISGNLGKQSHSWISSLIGMAALQHVLEVLKDMSEKLGGLQR